MGLESLVRSVRRGVGVAALGVASLVSMDALAPRSAAADVVVPTVAATAGQHGSNWQSDLRVANPYDKTISYTLVFTERGQSMSASDARVSSTLGPNQVLFYPDAYHVGYPGRSGVARVLVQMDTDPTTGQKFPDPVVDATVFNDAGAGAEFGQAADVYTLAQVEGMTGTYRLIVGKDGTRTNPAIVTGSQGATFTVTARSAAGGDPLATQTITLPANGYFQWSGNPDGVAALMGAAVPANSTLDFALTSGSGLPSDTVTNNLTNDSFFKTATKYTQITPTIVGLDYDHNGTVDNPVTPGGQVLEKVINVSCSAPFPFEAWLIAQPPGSYSYVGSNIPPGMGVEPGTGKIVYSPPCSTSGSTFTPAFMISGGTTSVTGQFRVTQ